MQGQPCSPPAALSDLKPPHFVLRIKYSAGAARSDGGDVLILKRPRVLDEVEITVFPSSTCSEQGTQGARLP